MDCLAITSPDPRSTKSVYSVPTEQQVRFRSIILRYSQDQRIAQIHMRQKLNVRWTQTLRTACTVDLRPPKMQSINVSTHEGISTNPGVWATRVDNQLVYLGKRSEKSPPTKTEVNSHSVAGSPIFTDARYEVPELSAGADNCLFVDAPRSRAVICWSLKFCALAIPYETRSCPLTLIGAFEMGIEVKGERLLRTGVDATLKARVTNASREAVENILCKSCERKTKECVGPKVWGIEESRLACF